MIQNLTRRRLGLAVAATLAAPALARAADEPIRIGMVCSMTGAAAEVGKLAQGGARQALEQVNVQGVLGRKLELVVEDDQTTNPGAVLAFSRLASRGDIVAYLGPTRSTQMQALAPDMLKVGRPVTTGGTDPTLTQQGNRWMFRCRPSDLYSAKVMAAYGTKELKGSKWAIIYSTDTFGSNGSKMLQAALTDQGVKPVLVQGYTNQAADYSAIVLAIRQSGADVMGSYFAYETDLGVFARQLRQFGVNIPWVGSASTVATTAMRLAGPALFGTYAVVDFMADATPAAQAFATEFQKRYNVAADFQSAWTFDAINLYARAMADARSTEPEAIRSALIAMRGYQGAEGEYRYDDTGEGLRAYNVARNENGKIAFKERVAPAG